MKNLITETLAKSSIAHADSTTGPCMSQKIIRTLAMASVSLLAISLPANAQRNPVHDRPVDKCIADIELAVWNKSTPPPAQNSDYVRYGWWDVDGADDGRAKDSNENRGHHMMAMYAKEAKTGCLTDIALTMHNDPNTPPAKPDFGNGDSDAQWERRGYWDIDQGGAGIAQNDASATGMMALWVKKETARSNSPVIRGLALHASNESTKVRSIKHDFKYVGHWDVDGHSSDSSSVGGWMGKVTKGHFMMTLATYKGALPYTPPPAAAGPQYSVKPTTGDWVLELAAGESGTTQTLSRSISFSTLDRSNLTREFAAKVTAEISASFDIGIFGVETSVGTEFNDLVSKGFTSEKGTSRIEGEVCQVAFDFAKRDISGVYRWVTKTPVKIGDIETPLSYKTCLFTCSNDGAKPDWAPGDPRGAAACAKSRDDKTSQPAKVSELVKDKAKDVADKTKEIRKETKSSEKPEQGQATTTSQDPSETYETTHEYVYDDLSGECEEIIIDATDYSDALNIAPTSGTTAVFGSGVILNAPPYNDRKNMVEYEVDADSGDYTIFIEAAAASPRPVRVYVNGKILNASALNRATGGWGPEHQEFQEVAQKVKLKDGINTIRIERASVFPHIRTISLERDE